MALTAPQIAELQAIRSRGETVNVCEYIEVQWDANDGGETRYYGASKFNQQPPFASIGFDIEPRLLGEPFKQFEMFPDLRTETIPIIFDDIDKVVWNRFQTFGSGVHIEFFLYYPQMNAHESMWFGQLQAPQIHGWKTTQTIATNGSRGREQKVPKSLRPRECRFTFGGLLTAESLLTNGCKYDRHLGGTIGSFRTGSTPFADCPRDETACAARGMTPYFGGYNPDASAVVTDQQSGYLAQSKGNTSSLKDPIRVIAGTKTVRANQLLHWRREMNANDQDRGFVSGVWEIGEGPVRAIRGIKVGEKVIEQMHLAIRLGTPAQTNLFQYAPDIGNYSNVAMYFARKGWVDPLTENAQTMQSECVVEGYTEVTQLTDIAAGAGLKGEYYSDTAFTTEVFERVDATINFPATFIAPVQGVSVQAGFSIKWTGTITFPFSETFTFSSIHEDGILLTINGGTVINQASAGTHTGTFAATASVAYSFELKLTVNAASGFNQWASILTWESSSQAVEVVPAYAFAQTGTFGIVRSYSNNRVWWVLEFMHNQRFGMSYPLARFNAVNWGEIASWSYQPVVFSYTNVDSETRTFNHIRTQFDAVVEGRPVAELLVDICRSGGVSIPYQDGGVFKIAAFRAFTDAELAAAKVYTDMGAGQNILWEKDGSGKPIFPRIEYSQIPNDRIINEITVVFEDGSNKDNERPITVDDPDQKLKAGRTLGEDNLQTIPTRLAAYGVKNLNEAVKFGYKMLRFGQFDEGGTLNNGTITIDVPLVEALGIERYGVIKVTSELLTGIELPGDGQLQYFRVRQIIKTSSDTATIIAQAYNHTAYRTFETLQVVPPGGGGGGGEPPPFPPEVPPSPLPPDGPAPEEPPTNLTFNDVTYDKANGFVTVDLS